MATQRYISTSFWDDEWVQTLDPSEKLLYLYLMTNPLTNIAGVYKITDKRISFDTGFNLDTIRHIFAKFENNGKVYRKDEYIAIPSWPKHQKWDKSVKVNIGIKRILKEFDPELLEFLTDIGYRYPIYTLDIQDVYPSNYSDFNSNFNSNSNSDSDSINRERERPTPIKIPTKVKRHTSQDKAQCGTYKNILLSKDEYTALCNRFGKDNTRAYINKVSTYMQSKGKTYADHYATVQQWLEDDLSKGQIRLPSAEIVMPTKCDKCGKPLVDGKCASCNRRVYGEGGSYHFEDIPDPTEIQRFAEKMRSFA